ncbi:hypothetical protein DID80_03055 [Candidatus Marinamargulisbacteria bacterium SCGC AAA071-K20]|nr:hypothetical protein DID80_03055 [Candidatus Marinamargulisbacteria bacterium SCGC AAA071-K20]
MPRALCSVLICSYSIPVCAVSSASFRPDAVRLVSDKALFKSLINVCSDLVLLLKIIVSAI